MTLAPLAPIYGRAAYEVVDGCWLWRGAKNSKGYPIRGSKTEGKYLVHRRLYEQKHGELPAGIEVHHRCKNPSCVNVDHLAAHTTRSHRRADGNAWLAEALLEALYGGPLRHRELELVALDAGAGRVGSSLWRLVENGEVVRLKRGLYALAGESV